MKQNQIKADKNRLLLIEDHEDLGNVTRQYLENVCFEVEWFRSGEAAYKAYSENPSLFDLVIIDVQLPGMNGFELAEKLQQMDSDVLFLFLTVRNEKQERLRGLRIGAADYISKPFDIDELVLRIQNIIRRNSTVEMEKQFSKKSVIVGDIALYKESLTVNIEGYKQVPLTLREFELLEILCMNPNQVVKREDILMNLWGENDYFLGRSLDVFISRLRKMLTNSKYTSIENVYGVGFLFKVFAD